MTFCPPLFNALTMRLARLTDVGRLYLFVSGPALASVTAAVWYTQTTLWTGVAMGVLAYAVGFGLARVSRPSA
jgi:uncharacterized membrane protein YGL010W